MVDPNQPDNGADRDDAQNGIKILGVEESGGYRADEVLAVEVDGVRQDVPITCVRRSELRYRGETPTVFDVDHVFVYDGEPHGGAWVDDGERYVELMPDRSFGGSVRTHHDTGRYADWQTDVFDADEIIEDEFPYIWERSEGGDE